MIEIKLWNNPPFHDISEVVDAHRNHKLSPQSRSALITSCVHWVGGDASLSMKLFALSSVYESYDDTSKYVEKIMKEMVREMRLEHIQVLAAGDLILKMDDEEATKYNCYKVENFGWK